MRWWVRCFLYVLISGGAAAGAAPVAYPPVDVEMALHRVSEHVYYVQGEAGAAFEHKGFISNASAVITGEGIVVLDALGSPSLARLFRERLREVSDQPVTKVLVSHYHADHIYGLQVFKDEGAEIYAPAGAKEYINSPQARERLEERRFSLEPWVNEQTRLVGPDHIVSDVMRFEQGGVEFVVTPVGAAHSDGDMTVYVEPDRVLLSGDVIFEGRVPFVGDANTGHWLDALRRMEARQVAALVPGHGPAAANPGRAVTLTRRYLAFLRQKMGAAVNDFVPFDQAYRAVDWSEFEHLPAFEAANRGNAYRVYLSMEAESF